MEFCSLLESYGHVVYENKKSFEKKVSEKYFFEWWKIFDRIFLTLFGRKFSSDFQKNRDSFFLSFEKKNRKKMLFFYFFIFVNYMNIAFQQAIGRYLTPFGRGERAIWIPRPFKIEDFYLGLYGSLLENPGTNCSEELPKSGGFEWFWPPWGRLEVSD